MKLNIKSLSKQDMLSFVNQAGMPSFRAGQMLEWIYEKYAVSIEDITVFSKDLRKRLSEEAYISNLNLLKRQTSKDGAEKFLFGLEDGETIESVLIPDKDRITICISSQVGCAMGCRFCLTAKLGLKRNLKPYEIVDQIISVSRIIAPAKITNIVFMGMGEPLSNFENTVEVLWRIKDLMNFSPRRVTLSTVGIAPKIIELSKKAPPVNLAISLNATTDAVRDYIMPVNRKYPIKELLGACRKFPLSARRRITFEYVLLKGINDTPEDARRLVTLLKGIPSKVNLIPFNPVEGSEFERPEDDRVLNFQDILLKGKLTAMIRKSRGDDILAACGQLKAKYEI